MNRFAATLALAAGIACAVFGYEPPRHNDTYTTNGVTYAQRGGLGAADYVVTNVASITPPDYAAVSNAAMNAAARVIVVTNFTAATGTTNDVFVCDVDGTIMRCAQMGYWSGTGTNSYGLVGASQVAPPLVEWEVFLDSLGEWNVSAFNPLTHEYLYFPVVIGGQPDGIWLDWDTAITNDVLTGRFDDPSQGIHIGPFHIRRRGLFEVEAFVAYSNDVALTPIYAFSEWTVKGLPFITSNPKVIWMSDAGLWKLTCTAFGRNKYAYSSAEENALELNEFFDANFDASNVTATRVRTDIIGYTLGSQTDKPLQPKGDYAPATNIAKSALAQDVQTSLGKADTALQTAPVTSVNNKTGAVSLSASDVDAVGNSGNQTMNGLLRVYQNEYRLGNEVLLVGSKTFGLGLNPSQIIFFDNGIKYTIEVPPASGTLALTSDIPSVAGQTFNFATTQGVMDALKTVIEALGGTVTNAPSLTISQGE